MTRRRATSASIDSLVGLPPAPGDPSWRDDLRPLLKDEESLGGFQHPASYMFKNLPDERYADDPPRAVLEAMDQYGVERAFIGVSRRQRDRARARSREHPDRFFAHDRHRPEPGHGRRARRCGTRSRNSG